MVSALAEFIRQKDKGNSLVSDQPCSCKNDPTYEITSSQQQEQLQVKWLGFNDGLAQAKSENKPIFVEFYAEWCIYCKKFHRANSTCQTEAFVSKAKTAC
jgi:thiol:disulfide interchange protein